SIILGHFELLQPAETVLQGVLDARLRLGALDLPLAHVLSFVAVVLRVYLTTHLVMTLLEEDGFSRMTPPRGGPYAPLPLTPLDPLWPAARPASSSRSPPWAST